MADPQQQFDPAALLAEQGNQQQQVVDSGGNGQQQQSVPYDRFQQVIQSNQELKQRLDAIEQANQQSSQTQQTQVQQDQNVDISKLDQQYWQNPREYTDQKAEQMYAALQDDMDYRMTLGKFRSMPGYSQDLEQSMVKSIEDYGLKNSGRGNAIRVAFEIATGKKFDSTGSIESDYSTKRTKQRLTRPTSTQGAGTQPEAMGQDAFKNMSLEEFRKDPKGIVEKYGSYLEKNKQ